MSTPLFTIQINANSPDELDNAIRVLATAFGNMDRLTEVATVTGGTVQPLTGEASLDLAIERPQFAESAPKTEAPEAPEAPATNVPASSTTAASAGDDIGTMRQDAIHKLTAWFGSNPGELGRLQQLQSKYGVKLFKDIPDDKVREFAQDAHLLVSGAGEA